MLSLAQASAQAQLLFWTREVDLVKTTICRSFQNRELWLIIDVRENKFHSARDGQLRNFEQLVPELRIHCNHRLMRSHRLRKILLAFVKAFPPTDSCC